MKRVPRLTVRGAVDRRFVQQINQLLREKNIPRRKHWSRLLGYGVAELIQHLESKFVDGMNWDAFLRGEIEIDHIKPQAEHSFTTLEDPQFLEAWSLNNLQPLWKKDNRSKGAKWNSGIDVPVPSVTG